MDESPEQIDERELLAELAAGSERAFAALYDHFGPRLYRTALGILGRRHDAEDAVQEVFVALVRARKRLAEVRDVPAYLFASLRRAAVRRAAQRAREPAGSDLALRDVPSTEPAADDARSDALGRALRALPAAQQEVIALKIDGQLTFNQIGQVLEISAHTAASRYRYALERLRDRLQER